MDEQKAAVHDFWNAGSCGEHLYLHEQDYAAQGASRYALEPYILAFADFAGSQAKAILEVGVGLGADHEQFARAGAILAGVDLTERAVQHTRDRLRVAGLHSELQVADAENLPFADGTFDAVYSWGVLHHSPDTPRAVDQVWRVLKEGGTAKVMIYHKYSLVGLMLWLRYGALHGLSLSKVYSAYLESPGTKAYSVQEARAIFSRFSNVDIRLQLSHGDLLSSQAGQRHQGPLLEIAKLVWPRWLFRRMNCLGLFMLITATK